MSCEFLIWSFEHGEYWRAHRAGYTANLEEAGRYTLADAVQICADGNLLGDAPQNGEAIICLDRTAPTQSLRTNPSRELLEVEGGPDGSNEGRGTGIFVRAIKSGKPASVDICELDRASLQAWLRLHGGANLWAESVVLHLLGHE